MSYSRRSLPGLLVVISTIAGIGIACVSPLLAQSGGQASRRATEDLPAGSMQAKATTACLECHEARIILQQRLSKGAWTKELDKMTKWGAVVDPIDRDTLIGYLSTNFGPDQPPYEALRTSRSKTALGKTTHGNPAAKR